MPGSDYLILKRRAQEESRMRFEEVCKENHKVSCGATWEIRTSNAIDAAKVQRRYESIRAADAAQLEARRQRLSAMLASEQAMFERQLDDLEEKPQERKARMQARAMELKDKRESERLHFVNQQYERQWRLACDPLREQDSKLIVKATNAARAYQIGEKMRQLEIEEQESRAFDEMWERDRQAKLGREEADAAARKAMDASQKAVLDRQVAELQNYRTSEKALMAQEAAMLREQCELERDEAKRVEAMRGQMIAQAHSELVAFNSQKRSHLQAAVTQEKREDSERLAAALKSEAMQEAREQAAKLAMQQETKLFAEHMMAQKRELDKFEAEQEAIRQLELDKAWDKRLEVWGQEQEARERLMASVLDERKLQVMTKLEKEQIAKRKAATDRLTLESELHRVNKLEADKLADARNTRMEHRALLEQQMKDKAFKKAAAEFDKSQERAAAERAEAHYQTMLNDQLAKTQAQMSRYT